MKPHAVPDLQVLKFRDDVVSVVDLAANKVLEPFIAVEPAPSLS
jgi:hypothetical protein